MLEIKNLTVIKGKKRILDGINLNFLSGESHIIIGESGAGKTTLAKIIIGLEKIDKGEVLFKGDKLKSLKDRSFRQCAEIQYIFQDPYSALEEEYTVRKTFEETLRICRGNNWKTLEIEESIKLVDPELLKLLDQKIKILSGGQRQKICIARALMVNPKIIIADESTGMLDEKSSEEILKKLIEISKEKGIILISIMHEIDYLQRGWDRLHLFKDGKVLESRNFEEFFENPYSDFGKLMVEGIKWIKSIL